MRVLILLVFFISSAATANADTMIRDRNGQIVGSIQKRSDNTTVYRSKEGTLSGTARPNVSGGLNYYDKYGSFTGSSTNNQRR